MATLKNIKWESIDGAPSFNLFAQAVKRAEFVASKIEDKISGGKNFYEAVIDGFEEDPVLKHDRDMRAKVIGLLYSCWDRGEQFASYYKFKHGRDLNDAPTIIKASAIQSEAVGRTKNRQ